MIRKGSTADYVELDPCEVCKIQPMDNVYSFLMFTLPLESKASKDKGMTSKTCVAYLLVLEGLSWQNSIMQPLEMPGLFLAAPQDNCNTGESLCSGTNGTFTCAPPSVQLAGRWNDLDTDNDG